MRNFAECCPDGPIVQQPVAQLPWGHVVAITQRLKSPASRDFYIRETLAHGWSRSILELQIQNQLHLRAGQAQDNFSLTMPPADSDLAAQLFKGPTSSITSSSAATSSSAPETVPVICASSGTNR